MPDLSTSEAVNWRGECLQIGRSDYEKGILCTDLDQEWESHEAGNSTMAGLGTTVFEVDVRPCAQASIRQPRPGLPGRQGTGRCACGAHYLLEGHNQYPPMMGLPELRQAVAEHAKRFQGLDVDWSDEVMVTSGRRRPWVTACSVYRAGRRVVL